MKNSFPRKNSQTCFDLELITHHACPTLCECVWVSVSSSCQVHLGIDFFFSISMTLWAENEFAGKRTEMSVHSIVVRPDHARQTFVARVHRPSGWPTATSRIHNSTYQRSSSSSVAIQNSTSTTRFWFHSYPAQGQSSRPSSNKNCSKLLTFWFHDWLLSTHTSGPRVHDQTFAHPKVLLKTGLLSLKTEMATPETFAIFIK